MWLEELLQVLGGLASERCQSRAREERHGTQVLFRERLAQDRVSEVALVFVRVLRFLASGGEGLSAGPALAKERVPVAA